MLNETDFLKYCEEKLTNLCDEAEKLDKDSKLDVDYSDGILEIIVLDTDQTYVINRNSGNQKIWYSSPLTGANYFSYDENSQKWLDDKGDELTQKLFLELNKIL